MSIINTVVKDPAANSYITAAQAASYLTLNRLYATSFVSLPVSDQEALCIWATRLIDTCFEFVGIPRTLTQNLRWPRSGARKPDGYWYDYDAIPEPLKFAVAELAFWLSKRDRTAEPDILGYGLESIKVGSLDLKVSAEQVISLIPREIAAMLQWLGSVTGPDEGGQTIDLVRS